MVSMRILPRLPVNCSISDSVVTLLDDALDSMALLFLSPVSLVLHAEQVIVGGLHAADPMEH